jgi:hypothetical protein
VRAGGPERLSEWSAAERFIGGTGR